VDGSFDEPCAAKTARSLGWKQMQDARRICRRLGWKPEGVLP